MIDLQNCLVTILLDKDIGGIRLVNRRILAVLIRTFHSSLAVVSIPILELFSSEPIQTRLSCSGSDLV